MHLGRPCLQFSNGPVSTDKHIYIYIRTWRELKEPQTSLSTTSSFYRLENGVLETVGRTIVKLELELRFSVLCPPTTSQTFSAHASALCTHTHTSVHRCDVCSPVHTPGAIASRGRSPRCWTRVPIRLWNYSVNLGHCDCWFQFRHLQTITPSSFLYEL